MGNQDVQEVLPALLQARTNDETRSDCHESSEKHRPEVLQICGKQKLHSRIPQSDCKKRIRQMLVVSRSTHSEPRPSVQDMSKMAPTTRSALESIETTGADKSPCTGYGIRGTKGYSQYPRVFGIYRHRKVPGRRYGKRKKGQGI